MVELTLLGYRNGASMLYRIDVRFKLLFVVLISLACLNASVYGLAIISVLFAVLLFNSSFTTGLLLKSLRWTFVLLGLVFAARALSEPGDPVFVFLDMDVTRQGLYQGMLVCWRLLTVILAGVLLSTSTRAADVKAGVQWILTPIPLIPAERVATMMGLILRFMPLVLEQARETAAAQRARGVENRKNPIYRLRVYALPLLRRTFERADRLALAMEARCYSEHRRDSGLSAALSDWLALAFVAGICLTAILL